MALWHAHLDSTTGYSTLIYLKLLSFSFLLATGQILFKQAALRLGETISVTALLFNGWLISALALYGAATILWVIILRTTPLSLAYPFAALGFIIVPAAAHFLFKETLSVYYIFGVILIATGIVLTNLK